MSAVSARGRTVRTSQGKVPGVIPENTPELGDLRWSGNHQRWSKPFTRCEKNPCRNSGVSNAPSPATRKYVRFGHHFAKEAVRRQRIVAGNAQGKTPGEGRRALPALPLHATIARQTRQAAGRIFEKVARHDAAPEASWPFGSLIG